MSEVDCTPLFDADRSVKAQLMSRLTTQSYRSDCGPERQVGTHCSRSPAVARKAVRDPLRTPTLSDRVASSSQ